MIPSIPKLTKELLVVGNYILIIAGIVLILLGTILYFITKKKRNKIWTYSSIGSIILGLAMLANNAIQYFIFQ